MRAGGFKDSGGFPRTASLLVGALAMLLASCGTSKKATEAAGPSVPQNFRLLGAGDGQTLLGWDPNPEPNIAGYLLYRSENGQGDFRQLARVEATQYADRYLNYDTLYVYRLAAVDLAGKESGLTYTISVRPLNVSPPISPRGLVVRAHNLVLGENQGIDLSWLPNEESDLAQYLIYRGSQPDFVVADSTLVDSTVATSYVDRLPEPGVVQNYRIVAVDLGGLHSDPGNPAGDLILGQVGLLSPTGNAAASVPIQFLWREVENAEGYVVELDQYPYSSPLWRSVVLPRGTTEATYSGPSLSPGTSYTWWVGAYSRILPTDSEGKPVEAEINSQSQYGRFIYR